METKKRTVSILVSKLASVSEEVRNESLTELRFLTKHHPEIRPIVVTSGAIPCVSESLYSSSHDAQENAAATLLNLSIASREELVSDASLLDAVSHLLRHHSSSSSPSAVQAAAALIYSLLAVEDHRALIGSKRDILYSLVDIIRYPKSPTRSIKDALKALFVIAQHQGNRGGLVGLGLVEALFGLVMRDGRRGIVEDATAVIAQVAGCEECESAFARVSGVRVLGDLLEAGLSLRIRENAIAGLLNLARNGGRVKELGELDVMEGIVDVLENGSEKGRMRGAQLLDVINGRQPHVGR